MNQTTESNGSCGNYAPSHYGIIEPRNSAPSSQVDVLLEEGGALLDELSEEINRSCGQFDMVLLPKGPILGEATPCPQDQPVRSQLAGKLSARNSLLRGLIAELRAINNRSTVAP